MDPFKQQLQRISEQLGGLSATQKMLTASLLAIIIMTLLWWARFAATPEMVPVLDRSIESRDVMPIKSALALAGIDARVVNDRVMVPAERHLEALAALGYANKLPSESSDAWDQIITQSSPWDTSQKTSALFNRAKQAMLSQMIQRYFPNVTSANVVIEPTSQRQIGGGGDLHPSASVFIDARDGADLKQIANGAAATVASAQAGLSIGRVTVVINGRNYRPHDPTDEQSFGDGTLYERKQEQEQYYVRKIRQEAIAHLPDALVTVSVELELSSSKETRESYDASKTVSKETSIDTESSETVAQNAAPSQEPGAQANTGLSAESSSAAGSGADTTTMEKNRTQLQVYPGKSVEQILKPAGKSTVTGAAVRVPQSYFVQQFKRRSPSAGEPDDASLQPLIAPELEQIRKQVMTCCGLKTEDAVSVGTYFDLAPMMAAAVAEASGGSSMTGLLGAHVKEIAAGSLALLSLFMVMMMVRRSSTVTTVAAPVELSEVTPLATGEDIAGEVGEGSAMLDGMELDDDTIKAQQMVEQVATMVKENPDGAANLVKRWLNRS